MLPATPALMLVLAGELMPRSESCTLLTVITVVLELDVLTLLATLVPAACESCSCCGALLDPATPIGDCACCDERTVLRDAARVDILARLFYSASSYYHFPPNLPQKKSLET